MLLGKIGEDFKEINEIIGVKALKSLLDILRNGKFISKEDILSWNYLIRDFSKSEALIENRRFKTDIVQFYAKCFVENVEKLFKDYDYLARLFRNEQNIIAQAIREKTEELYDSIADLSVIIEKINMANDLIVAIEQSTWEPLPDDKNEDNVESIVISSETRNVSLNDVASDVGNLNSFFENICRLISSDQSLSDNIYLRRVETGSLLVAVSCTMQAAPIIAFIFWCVKLYQKAEKRYLDNADNKLKVINDSLNIAKEILKIDPDNKEADEIIQKCGVSVLSFLENNPTGTINGEHYDIGMEKPKIEDKENK